MNDSIKPIWIVVMTILVVVVVWAVISAIVCKVYQAQPDMSVVQSHSPVNIGDDEGRLEASRNTPDSVLVACKRDPGQPRVYSKGRRAVGTHIYSVSDDNVGGGCNRNNTGQRLNQHWLEQGSLQSQVSNH